MTVMTAELDDAPIEHAPDGSRVRPLVSFDDASMAHFELRPNATTSAVKHRRVKELWFVVGGSGAIWREGTGETRLGRGTAIAIDKGVAFQFRADGDGLEIVAVTVPAWRGDEEAERVAGRWTS